MIKIQPSVLKTLYLLITLGSQSCSWQGFHQVSCYILVCDFLQAADRNASVHFAELFLLFFQSARGKWQSWDACFNIFLIEVVTSRHWTSKEMVFLLSKLFFIKISDDGQVLAFNNLSDSLLLVERQLDFSVILKIKTILSITLSHFSCFRYKCWFPTTPLRLHIFYRVNRVSILALVFRWKFRKVVHAG